MLAIISILLSPLSCIWSGYVLAKMWSWFMIPYFHIQPISIPLAIAFTEIAAFMTKSVPFIPKDDEYEIQRSVHSLLMAIIKPALFLLLSWILLKFM